MSDTPRLFPVDELTIAEPERRALCADCAVNTAPWHLLTAPTTGEWYVVHDELWAAAGMGPRGFLCLACLEERLGRPLGPDDFKDVPLVNRPSPANSRLLNARLAPWAVRWLDPDDPRLIRRTRRTRRAIFADAAP